MKFIKLSESAYVNGVLRHPHEGVLHVSNEEGKRLLDAEMAEDVTDDFPAEDKAETRTESVATGRNTAPNKRKDA